MGRDGFDDVPDKPVDEEDLQDQDEDHHGQLEKETKTGRDDLS